MCRAQTDRNNFWNWLCISNSFCHESLVLLKKRRNNTLQKISNNLRFCSKNVLGTLQRWSSPSYIDQQTTILSWLTSIAFNFPALLEDVYWYTKQNEVIVDFQLMVFNLESLSKIEVFWTTGSLGHITKQTTVIHKMFDFGQGHMIFFRDMFLLSLNAMQVNSQSREPKFLHFCSWGPALRVTD